jgi:hypothetical protein
MPITVRGDQRMLLQYVDFSRAADQGLITGSIARFVEIDPNTPWFDFVKLDVAADEDVEKIEIPENLRPNYRSFYFEFFVREHMFVYEHTVPKALSVPMRCSDSLNDFSIVLLCNRFTAQKAHPVVPGSSTSRAGG